MPISGFHWVDDDEIKKIDWLTQTDDQQYGYFVDCDLDYAGHLHEEHNDYPLAP